MSSSYRAVFARTGARSLALSCGLGWLSFAGYGLAVVLAVEAATGSFAVAGTAVAAFAAGSGLLAPARGRIVDARGARILPVFALVHAAGLALLVAGCAASLAPALLVIAAGLAGTSTPPLIATARAVWPQSPARTWRHRPRGERRARRCGARDRRRRSSAPSPRSHPRRRARSAACRALSPARSCSPRSPHRAADRRDARTSHRVWGVLSESAGLRRDRQRAAVRLSFGALDVAAPVSGGGRRDGAGGAPARGVRDRERRGLAVVGNGRLSGRRPRATSSAPDRRRGPVARLVVRPVASRRPARRRSGLRAAQRRVFELIEDLVASDRAVEAFTWLTTCAGAGIAGGAALAGNSGAPLVVVALPAALAGLTAPIIQPTVDQPRG